MLRDVVSLCCYCCFEDGSMEFDARFRRFPSIYTNCLACGCQSVTDGHRHKSSILHLFVLRSVIGRVPGRGASVRSPPPFVFHPHTTIRSLTPVVSHPIRITGSFVYYKITSSRALGFGTCRGHQQVIYGQWRSLMRTLGISSYYMEHGCLHTRKCKDP